MASQTIPIEQWDDFLDSYSLQHHGWLVDVRTVPNPPSGTGHRAKTQKTLLAHNLPLQEIREEPHEESADIMVTVGSGLDQDSFLITDVTNIYIIRSNGSDIGLQLDNNSELITLIEFRAPAIPEMLDGLAESEF